MSFRPTSGYHRVVSFGKKALYVKIALAKCFGQNILHGSLLCHKMLKCNLDPLKDFLGLTREVNQLQKSTLTNLLSWSWFVLVAMLIFRGANMIHLDFSREQSMLFLKVYSFWSFSKQS